LTIDQRLSPAVPENSLTPGNWHFGEYGRTRSDPRQRDGRAAPLASDDNSDTNSGDSWVSNEVVHIQKYSGCRL
jgi:hypothetical protein